MTDQGKRKLLKLATAGLVMAAPVTSLLAASEKKVEYLYVQTAHAVSYQDGKLTLHGVGPTTLFFSDRPDRIAGHGTTEEMVKTWSQGEDSFAADPPNATLSILGDAAIEDVVVELSKPVLLGSKLTYDVRVLNGKMPASGGAASLFIDIIGMPLTPYSYAGAYRRAFRR
jgi:hypothetical protein